MIEIKKFENFYGHRSYHEFPAYYHVPAYEDERQRVLLETGYDIASHVKAGSNTIAYYAEIPFIPKPSSTYLVHIESYYHACGDGDAPGFFHADVTHTYYTYDEYGYLTSFGGGGYGDLTEQRGQFFYQSYAQSVTHYDPNCQPAFISGGNGEKPKSLRYMDNLINPYGIRHIITDELRQGMKWRKQFTTAMPTGFYWPIKRDYSVINQSYDVFCKFRIVEYNYPMSDGAYPEFIRPEE